MPHAVLIAVIFVPYIVLMAGLGCYIWKTGQPAGITDTTDTDDAGEKDERDPGPVLLRAAA
jgi:hypothetical protein